MKVIFSLFCLFIIQIYAAPNIARPVVPLGGVDVRSPANDAVVVSENSKPRVLPQPAPKVSGGQVGSDQKVVDPKQNQLELDQVKPGSQQQIPSNSQKVSQIITDGQQKIASELNTLQQTVQREESKPVQEQSKVAQEPKYAHDKHKPAKEQAKPEMPKPSQEQLKPIQEKKKPAKEQAKPSQEMPKPAQEMPKPDKKKPAKEQPKVAVDEQEPKAVDQKVGQLVGDVVQGQKSAVEDTPVVGVVGVKSGVNEEKVEHPVVSESVHTVLEPKKVLPDDQSKVVDQVPVRTDAQQQRLDSKQTQGKVGSESDVEARKPDEPKKDEQVVEVKKGQEEQEVKKDQDLKVDSKKDQDKKDKEEKEKDDAKKDQMKKDQEQKADPKKDQDKKDKEEKNEAKKDQLQKTDLKKDQDKKDKEEKDEAKKDQMKKDKEQKEDDKMQKKPELNMGDLIQSIKGVDSSVTQTEQIDAKIVPKVEVKPVKESEVKKPMDGKQNVKDMQKQQPL